MTTTFEQFNLPPQLRTTLAAMNFTTPTPVQEQTIPHALQGRDVLATAMTGSGKTGAFGIPIIARMQTGARGSALILTPTRELAQQVVDVIGKLLGQMSPIKTALLIGGESMPLQIQQLRARPRIIVGTPGRINDHLQRGTLMLHDANMLVLDEMDRMLDMGFEDQIMAILKYLPMARTTMLFSATLPPQIIKISEKYLKNPVRVEIGETNKPVERIDQQIIQTSQDGKYNILVDELKKREGTVIIFVRAKHATEKLASKLRKSGFTADAIHGDLEQRQREHVLQAFRDKKHRILVATDIASRGLDIPHIEHVINYDLPQAPEDYIHRIGRTARAGAEGAAVSFITNEDHLKWKAIQQLMNPETKYESLPGHKGSSTEAPRHTGGGERSGGSGDRNKRRRGGRNRGGRSEGGHSGDRPRQASSNPQSQASSAPKMDANAGGSNGGQTRQGSDDAAKTGPIHGLPPAI